MAAKSLPRLKTALCGLRNSPVLGLCDGEENWETRKLII